MNGSNYKTFIPAAALLTSLFLIGGCSSSANSNTASLGEALPQQTVSAAPSPSKSTPPSPVDTVSPTAASSNENGAKETITEQIAGMTLEDKIGQMLLVGIEGTALDERANKMIADDKVGGIILYADNIRSLKGMVKLTNDLKKSNEGNPAPLFISVDQEGGKVSRMPDEYAVIPANGKVGATGNAAAAGTMGRLLAREVLSAGFNMDFAPVLDIDSNPDNPVIGDRSFGSTADLVARLGIAELKGIESEGVIPVVKHFPGHGDTSVDSHLELPVVHKTAAQLAKLEWLPFLAAFKEHADAVMVAHILFPKIDPKYPASLSKVIIGEQLRGEMGFKGVVITDDLTMGAIAKNYSLASAAVDTVLAGSDILLVAHEYSNEQTVRKALLNAVASGAIPESRIDESVYRILSLKQKYQLTDNPVSVPDLTQLNQDIKAWRRTL